MPRWALRASRSLTPARAPRGGRKQVGVSSWVLQNCGDGSTQKRTARTESSGNGRLWPSRPENIVISFVHADLGLRRDHRGGGVGADQGREQPVARRSPVPARYETLSTTTAIEH